MEQKKRTNGIQVDQLFGTIRDVRKNPGLGLFKFRTENSWLDGTNSRAIVKNFYGLLREDASRGQLEFDLDEPPVLLGANRGANPVEYLLVALSGCLTTTLAAQAAIRGIDLRRVESHYEGELDLRGFLGISEDVPVGFENIRIVFDIDADISKEQKQELLAMAKKYSPVYNSIAKPVQVSIELGMAEAQRQAA